MLDTETGWSLHSTALFRLLANTPGDTCAGHADKFVADKRLAAEEPARAERSMRPLTHLLKDALRRHRSQHTAQRVCLHACPRRQLVHREGAAAQLLSNVQLDCCIERLRVDVSGADLERVQVRRQRSGQQPGQPDGGGALGEAKERLRRHLREGLR